MSITDHKITWQGHWYREAESDAAFPYENCYAGKVGIRDGRCQPNKLENTATSSSIRTLWTYNSVEECHPYKVEVADSNSARSIRREIEH